MALLRGLVRQMQVVGLPVARMTLGQRTLHPEIVALGYVWNADDDEVEIGELGHETHRQPTISSVRSGSSWMAGIRSDAAWRGMTPTWNMPSWNV